jgi:FixJ family two-component response regulator
MIRRVWTREQLAARVDELRQREPDFVAAVRAFAEQLSPQERQLLGDVLMERADSEHALRERIDTRGWFRRQWDKLP